MKKTKSIILTLIFIAIIIGLAFLAFYLIKNSFPQIDGSTSSSISSSESGPRANDISLGIDWIVF